MIWRVVVATELVLAGAAPVLRRAEHATVGCQGNLETVQILPLIILLYLRTTLSVLPCSQNLATVAPTVPHHSPVSSMPTKVSSFSSTSEIPTQSSNCPGFISALTLSACLDNLNALRRRLHDSVLNTKTNIWSQFWPPVYTQTMKTHTQNRDF